MQRIITLAERKGSEAARRRAAVDALLPALTDYARTHGGRFLLYGSAARGQMKYHSDVDLLLDFPAEALSEAWSFAEKRAGTCGWSRICCPIQDASRPFWSTSRRMCGCWHE